jgi:hypothetical protein
MNAPAANALYFDAVAELSFTELATVSGLPEEDLRALVRYGALAPRDPDAPTWTFEARWVAVARAASRIRRDFELDPHAVSVVLCYRERIEVLEAELRMLRALHG